MSKFCASCGAALEEGQQFCGSCGKSVQGSGTAGASLEQTSAPAQTSTPGTDSSGQKLWVLSILLGWLGVHCFVTGKKKRGTVELLLGLISVILQILGLLRMVGYIEDEFAGEINSSTVFQAVIPYVFIVLFLIFWIPDLIGIVKGRFANAADKVPGFINAVLDAGLPKWKFSKKHLVFIVLIALLYGLARVIGNAHIPILPMVLGIPFALCGVFFGPFLGTVIAGVLLLISSLILSFAEYGWFHSFYFNTLFFILPFVSGYIVYGIPKIRALRDKQVFSNKIAQGLLIGIAVLVGSLIGTAAYMPFVQILIQAVLAGVVGVLLLFVLAKKGLLLGPFVKEGEPQSSPDVKQAKEF
jgi:hypothetical protein